jgi:tetratricopeptide (TPR) repeat protein
MLKVLPMFKPPLPCASALVAIALTVASMPAWAEVATPKPAQLWSIPPGQEAVLEHALAPTPAWPKGWQLTGASINRGVIDARYQDPTGLGLGIRLQHPQFEGGPRQAGQFEIASISAELPDAVIAQIKLQLAAIPTFKWTQLHDREGEATTALPSAATATAASPVQEVGDALIAQHKAGELLALMDQEKSVDCAMRLRWVNALVQSGDGTQFTVARDVAKKAPACPRVLAAVAGWTATLGKPADGDVLIREALAADPQNPMLRMDLALLLRQQDRCADALTELGKIDMAKVADIADHLSRISRIYIDCPDAALLERLKQRADGKTPDPIAAFVVGAILHHQGKWLESDKYMLAAEPLMHSEPREYLYRAMNAFHEGRQAEAEQLLGHCVQMHSADPDVLYCRAVIYADSNPDQAIADLEAYDKAMLGTLDKTPGKQERVRVMLGELRSCRGAKDIKQCRQLRKAGREAVRWAPGVVLLLAAMYAVVRWRRRR